MDQIAHRGPPWRRGSRRKKNTARSFHRAVSIAQSWAGWDGLLLGLFVGVDDAARLVLGRGDDDLDVRILELVHGVALDAAELRLEHARLCELATLAERNVADDGLKRGLADVVGELAVVEALGRRDRLAEDVEIRVAVRRHVVAERIAAGLGRAILILLHDLARAR